MAGPRLGGRSRPAGPRGHRALRREAWSEAESADELHDALLILTFLHEAESEANEGVWPRLFAALCAAGRATVLTAGGLRLWVPVEPLPEILAYPRSGDENPRAGPGGVRPGTMGARGALTEVLKTGLGALGPLSPAALARDLRVPENKVMATLHALEAQGVVLRSEALIIR